MRGIERLATGALLVVAVTGTAVFARTSAPGGAHLQAVRLQSPPRSSAVAPLPVVVAVPQAPRHRVVVRPATPAPVVFAKADEVPQVAAAPAPAPASPPAKPPAPTPAPPAAPTPAPTPVPPSAPAPQPAPPTRTVAAAQPPQTATKMYGHSHPNGHAWGHVKHAVTTAPTSDDEAQAAQPAAESASAPAGDQSSADAGNGNGHAWGHSKRANDD